MLRWMTAFATAALFAVPALGQQPQPMAPPGAPGGQVVPGGPPGAPRGRPTGPGGGAALPGFPELRDEERLRYLMKQLALNPQQQQHAEGLLAVYLDAKQAKMAVIKGGADEIRAKYLEMDAARKAGDNARVEQIQKDLRDFTSNVQAENEFMSNLESVLTAEQKATLVEIKQRLEKNPTGTLRPVDVLIVARSLNLSPDQTKKLDEVREKFRAEANQIMPFDVARRNTLVDTLVVDVRGVLRPEQAAAFDKRIENWRTKEQLQPPAGPPAVGAQGMTIEPVTPPAGQPVPQPVKQP